MSSANAASRPEFHRIEEIFPSTSLKDECTFDYPAAGVCVEKRFGKHQMTEQHDSMLVVENNNLSERGMALAGQRVLVIEDEFMVSALIEDILLESGCQVVGIASRLSDAVEKATSLSFDVAIVDVNLNGQKSLPVAETLAKRGIPFVLASGYRASGLSEAFPDVPILQKPFHQEDLAQAISEALK
jgi:CheY-like chemotaxis protein